MNSIAADKEHSSECHGDANGSTAASNISKATLNPLATEWDINKNRAAEEARCLFLTFSKGHPFSEWEITTFFDQMFGGCVRTVLLFREDENPPLCAKVVFRFSYIPRAILGIANQAYFWVNGKPLWCKRYISKKNQNGEDL